MHELNPYFKQFDSIDGVIKNFKKFLEKNKLNVEQNDSELQLFFINPVDEEEKIYIKLNKIKEDDNTIINKLIQIIKDMKEENTNIKNELKTLKEQTIQSLMDDNKTMNEKIN